VASHQLNPGCDSSLQSLNVAIGHPTEDILGLTRTGADPAAKSWPRCGSKMIHPGATWWFGQNRGVP